MHNNRNECDNCQITKSPHHSQFGLLHPLEMAGKLWMDISTHFITNLSESEGDTMILVILDHFKKMAHFMLMKNCGSLSVPPAALENIWTCHWFPEDVV